jgi:hypothetical protein
MEKTPYVPTDTEKEIGKRWDRLTTAIIIIGLALMGFIAVLAANSPAPDSDVVVLLANGQEMAEDKYLSIETNIVPADPTITDLRDREGQNGMWYQIKKAGAIARLWRDGKYVYVQLRDGRIGKCTKLQDLDQLEDQQDLDEPYACLRHVKEFVSGQTRQDFIHLRVVVPADQFPAARRIQRGGAGDITFCKPSLP